MAARPKHPITLKAEYTQPKVILSVASDETVTLRWQILNGLNQGWKDSHLSKGVPQPPVQNQHYLVLPCYNTVQCTPDRGCNLTFRFGQADSPHLRTSIVRSALDSRSCLLAGSGMLLVKDA